MRYHKDIDKAGTTAYWATVQTERPDGYEKDGTPIYSSNTEVRYSAELPSLGLAKAFTARNLKRVAHEPDTILSGDIHRVSFVREDFDDETYGRVAWLDEQVDEHFYCYAYMGDNGVEFDITETTP